jgi:hypothetical protein
MAGHQRKFVSNRKRQFILVLLNFIPVHAQNNQLVLTVEVGNIWVF